MQYSTEQFTDYIIKTGMAVADNTRIPLNSACILRGAYYYCLSGQVLVTRGALMLISTNDYVQHLKLSRSFQPYELDMRPHGRAPRGPYVTVCNPQNMF